MSEKKQTLEKMALEKIEEMESPDYVFPERFPRGDYILVAAGLVVSAAVLILGAFIQ